MGERTKKQLDTIAFTGKLLAPISYLVWFVATRPGYIVSC